MTWSMYAKKFRRVALAGGKSQQYIEACLSYAKPLYAAGLPVIFSAEHLSLLVGIDPYYLSSMMYAPRCFYHCYQIPKRNGGKRKIEEPLPDLKGVQRWILDNVLNLIPVSSYSKAFENGLSIKDSARFHRRQEVVLNVDVKDFFSSIDRLDVFRVYKSIGYADKLCWALTNLSCYEGALPQGAPTSPYLSNLVMREFDEDVATYCLSRGYRFTRYADDITLSGNIEVRETLSFIKHELGTRGLSLHEDKTRVLRRGARQEVVGIVVNDHLQVEREYRRKIRQELYYIKKFGIESHLSHTGETRGNYLYHLLGKVNHVLFVNPKDKEAQEYKAYLIGLIRDLND